MAVKFVQLPFYEIKKCIFEPSRLEPDLRRPGMSQKLICFTLTKDVVDNLLYKNDCSPPKYEIQMRIVKFDTTTEQMDKLPGVLYITMNGQGVSVPPVIKPNAREIGPAAKRAQLPINLTPKVSRTTQRQSIELKWEGKPRESFAFGIWLVERVTSDTLYQKFMENGRKQSIEETQKLINKSFDDSDGIATDSLKISLKCPLTQCLMTAPVRSTNCSHLSCFDLRNYLKLNEVKTKWNCPVCNKLALYDTLELNLYFIELIKQAGDASEVEFFSNNQWEFIGAKKGVQKEVVAIEYEEVPDSPQSKQSKQLVKAGSAALLLDMLWREIAQALDPTLQETPLQISTRENNIKIIALSDSDEEDITEKNHSSSNRKLSYDKVTTDPNGITVITLDD